tara:strand:+ start:889 stop:1338 length:450 start_codon:yes stop_codon:yes gene_type:complete
MNKTGYIYKLICSETGKCYFGSTYSPVVRYQRHLTKGNSCSSRYLINPTMHILEVKKNVSKDELLLIEKYYILNNTCINKYVPRQTNKERYHKYIKNNPDYLKEQYVKSGGRIRNILTKKTCECGGVFVQRNLKIHLKTAKHNNYVNNI